MTHPAGLREAKKRRTEQLLAETALQLFLQQGYDQVSVADIAAAALVSKPTLFRYFPSKEDLVMQRFADRQGDPARIVRERAVGQTPVQALHEHFRAALRDHDPLTGITDDPGSVSFQRLLYSTPALHTRLLEYGNGAIDLLADALGRETTDELTARLAAVHLVRTRHELSKRNWRKIATGRSTQEVLPEALADADRAFDMLAHGIHIP